MEEEIKKSELTLGEKVDRLTTMIADGSMKEPISKKFGMPWKGKVSTRRLKNGYCTVCYINENDVADFTREQIIDGTIKLGDTFHSVCNEDVLIYKNKPLLIIPKKSKTPYNPNSVDNDTFGQKHIMSRMMNETLSQKKSMGMLPISIGAVILIGVIIYAFIAG